MAPAAAGRRSRGWAVRVHRSGAGDEAGGIGSLLATCLRTMPHGTGDRKTKAEGLPPAPKNPSVQVSPSRTPSKAQAEGASRQRPQRVSDEGLSHHPHPARGPCGVWGPLPASPPAPPKQQPCSAGAHGRGERSGLMGSPSCCAG